MQKEKEEALKTLNAKTMREAKTLDEAKSSEGSNELRQKIIRINFLNANIVPRRINSICVIKDL
jgi:hypothetical protein